MKRLFPLLLPLLAFAGFSCERHEFEGPDGTKQLHEHGHHAEQHAGEHGGGHDQQDGAGKDQH